MSRECEAVSPPTLSSPGSTGRSSTPRPFGSSTGVSGILDHPLSRVMTPRCLIVNREQSRPSARRKSGRRSLTAVARRAAHHALDLVGGVGLPADREQRWRGGQVDGVDDALHFGGNREVLATGILAG